MSDIIVLETIQKFLQDNVSPGIKLQKATDDDYSVYELVNPAVHIGWIPPKGVIPNEIDITTPCIIVGFDESNDDLQESELNIRLSFAVFCPGSYIPDGDGEIQYTPNFEGYKNLLNFIQLTKDELIRKRILYGKTTIEGPFKSGMYQDQPYPYWYGWLTFSAKSKSGHYVPDIAQQFL